MVLDNTGANNNARLGATAGINLNGLIELFSRPPATQYHWTTEGGPWTFEEVKRGTRRGS